MLIEFSVTCTFWDVILIYMATSVAHFKSTLMSGPEQATLSVDSSHPGELFSGSLPSISQLLHTFAPSGPLASCHGSPTEIPRIHQLPEILNCTKTQFKMFCNLCFYLFKVVPPQFAPASEFRTNSHADICR